MQEKPKKGSRKTLLGSRDGEDGIWGVNWYLREGNVIFLLLVQMKMQVNSMEAEEKQTTEAPGSGKPL